MKPAGAPDIECEMHHTTLVVRDVNEAADFYSNKLGFRTAFIEGQPATFAGVNLGNVQMFLEKGTPDPNGCSVYFVVGNADELHEFHRSRGVEITDPPEDRPYELRDYGVRDLHGYRLRFGHRLLAPASQFRSSASTCRSDSRNGWPRSCTTSPSTSA